MKRERGFALLTVLWTLALLALVAAQLTTNGRSAVRAATNLRAGAVAELAADGAIHHAMLLLLRGEWVPDGVPRELRVGGAVVVLRVVSENLKLNPNAATVPAQAALLRRLGVDDARAVQLARAIVDWRSPGPRSLAGGAKAAQYRAAGLPYAPANHGFDSIGELGLVNGMTPAILARLKQALSIYQEGDTPDLDVTAMSPAELQREMAKNPWSFGASGRVMVVAIEAVATGDAGGRFARRAVARLRADPSLDQAPYEVLTWDTLE